MAHHGEEFGPYTEGNRKPGRVLHSGVTLSDRCVLQRCLWQLPGEGPGRVGLSNSGGCGRQEYGDSLAGERG